MPHNRQHHRGARRFQDVRHGQGAGAGAARHRSLGRTRRDGCRHGPQRLRQDDAPELPLRPRPNRQGRRRDRGRLARLYVRPRPHGVPRTPHGFRLPVLQPAPRAERRRERRNAAARLAAARQAGPREGDAGARHGRSRRSRAARSGRALRRRASARHHRPRTCERPGHRLGGRAHGRPRQRQRAADHSAHARPQPHAGLHVRHRHSRHRASGTRPTASSA